MLSDKKIRKAISKAKKCPICGTKDVWVSEGCDQVLLECGYCDYAGRPAKKLKKALKRWNKDQKR